MPTKEQNRNPMSKIFRVAFLLFATTFGIGMYALIGAPIKRMVSIPSFSKIGNIINSANVAIINALPNGKAVNKGEGDIEIKLVKPETDFFTLKSTLINTTFLNTDKRIVTLRKGDTELSIPEFLYYVSDIKPKDSLIRTMQGSRYYISHDKEYLGTIVIPIKEEEIAFAGVIDWESKFVDYTLPLVRPLLSQADIKMYKDLKVVTRNISGVDTRVIIGANDTILYSWGIYKNNIIISSNKDDYLKIISALDKK